MPPAELHNPPGARPDQLDAQPVPPEQHVATVRPGAPAAAAAGTSAAPAEAAQPTQQPLQAAEEASTLPAVDETAVAAQQTAPVTSASAPDAERSIVSAISAPPAVSPPEQQQAAAEVVQQRSAVIEIPACPQQMPAANPKRPAIAPPSPPSPARSGSLSDADLPPKAPADGLDALQPREPREPAAAARALELDQQERQHGNQGQQQDVQEDTQDKGQQRQDLKAEPDEEQPQQPDAELAQQAQVASGAASAHRRNTPYVCQVDGCGRNLAKEKEYYRRYRVCKSHAGAQEVVLGGDAKRYCQQCSVFHPLTDFDGEKRSCRARLSWHNNKRRKRVVSEGEALAAAASSVALAPRVTRAMLAGRDKPSDEDGGVRSSGRVAARRVSSEAADGDDSGLQWGVVRGRRGAAAAAAVAASAASRGGPSPAAGVLPWGAGMGPGDEAQHRLVTAAAAGAAAAAAAAPPLLLGSQYVQQLQASSSLLAAAQAYAAGQRGPMDPGALAAQLGLPAPPIGPAWSALTALQRLDGTADTALRQAQMQHLAQLQASQAASEAAAAREAAAAQAAAQAAALAQLRDMPQQQRMQDPRAASSLINVVRAAFEKQQQQQQRQQQQQQQQGRSAGAHNAEDKDANIAGSSAFQPYRPTAVRAGPGSDATATAAAGGYACKPLSIAGGRAALAANGSPPKDGSADWKARLLQRFHSAHAEVAEEA